MDVDWTWRETSVDNSASPLKPDPLLRHRRQVGGQLAGATIAPDYSVA
jgi:hypothetical protein